MIFNNANLPRVFQANIDRFFIRVVQPSLEQLPQPDNVVFGEARSLDEFIDQCAKQVDEHTANEARRAFAFTLSAIFERQLRMWCHATFSEEDHKKMNVETEKIFKLLDQAVCLHKMNFGPSDKTVDDIKELHLLANVVRHGDGPSCRKLYTCARHFWNHVSDIDIQQAKEPRHLSERIRVKDEHLHRYVCALLRFWGLADREPFAVIPAGYKMLQKG